MGKHTPGPWDFFTDKPAYSVGPSHNHSVARVFNPPGGERDEIIANARLIAAAPDLLRLLKESVITVAETHRPIEDWLNESRSIIRKIESEINRG